MPLHLTHVPLFFFLSKLKPVLHSFFCAALSGFPLSWCPCPWLSSNPTKSPVPTGRTIVKTLLPWDSDESPEASPGPPGPRRGAGAGGPREEVGATPGPEEQDSLLLQRKSARRCVKQRPSYDVFEDSDDSEPGGPPAPRRRTPREHGMFLVRFMILPFGHSWGGIQGPLCLKLRRDRTPQSVQEG